MDFQGCFCSILYLIICTSCCFQESWQFYSMALWCPTTLISTSPLSLRLQCSKLWEPYLSLLKLVSLHTLVRWLFFFYWFKKLGTWPLCIGRYTPIVIFLKRKSKVLPNFHYLRVHGIKKESFLYQETFFIPTYHALW